MVITKVGQLWTGLHTGMLLIQNTKVKLLSSWLKIVWTVLNIPTLCCGVCQKTKFTGFYQTSVSGATKLGHCDIVVGELSRCGPASPIFVVITSDVNNLKLSHIENWGPNGAEAQQNQGMLLFHNLCIGHDRVVQMVTTCWSHTQWPMLTLTTSQLSNRFLSSKDGLRK